VILHRCFAWNERARPDRPDNALWFPRPYQGDGRHDNADLYGCLYLSERPLACVVEQLARFRGQRLLPALLVRRGLPLALAELELAERAELVDLDEPAVLRREQLRPSLVATRAREVTQPQARALYERHPAARSNSVTLSHCASNVDHQRSPAAAADVELVAVRRLTVEDDEIVSAADVLGLRPA
jgi:hypothetical protein